MGKVSFVNKQDRLREYEMRYLFARKEAFEAKAAVLRYCFALNKSTEALQPEKKKEIVKKLFGEEVLQKLEENIGDLGNKKRLKGIKDSDKREKFIKDKQAKFFNRTKKDLGLSEDQRLYVQAAEKDGALILKRRSNIASEAPKEDDVIGYIHRDVFRKDKASIEDVILLDEQKKEGLLENASWPLFVDLCFSITVAEIAKNAAEALKTPVSEEEIAELEKELKELQTFMSNLPEDNLNNLSDEDKKKAERFYAIAKIIKDNAPADSTVQEQVPEDKAKYFEWLKNLLKSGKSRIVKFFGSIKELFKEHASKVASEDKNQQIKKESEDQVKGAGEAAVEATDDKQVAAKVETAKEATKSDSKDGGGGGGSNGWLWALGGVAAVGGGIFALRKLLKTSNKKSAALRDARREYAHANFALKKAERNMTRYNFAVLNKDETFEGCLDCIEKVFGEEVRSNTKKKIESVAIPKNRGPVKTLLRKLFRRKDAIDLGKESTEKLQEFFMERMLKQHKMVIKASNGFLKNDSDRTYYKLKCVDDDTFEVVERAKEFKTGGDNNYTVNLFGQMIPKANTIKRSEIKNPKDVTKDMDKIKKDQEIYVQGPSIPLYDILYHKAFYACMKYALEHPSALDEEYAKAFLGKNCVPGDIQKFLRNEAKALSVGVSTSIAATTNDQEVKDKANAAKEAGGLGSRSWLIALGGLAAGGGLLAIRNLIKKSKEKRAAMQGGKPSFTNANFSLTRQKEKSGSYFRKINEGENMVSRRRLEQQKRIYIDARHDAHVHYLDTINYCNQVARAKNGTTVNFSIFPFFGNKTPRALTDQMCGSSEVRQIQEQIYRDFQDPNALAAVNRAMNEIKNGGCNAERTKQSLERLADCCPDRKTGAKLVTAAQRLGSQLSSEGWFFDGIRSKKDRQAKSKEFQDVFVNTADKVAKTKESGWLAGIWNSLKEWADDNKALAIIAGICVAGIITYSVYRLWKAHAKKQVALRNARQQLAIMQPGLMAPPAPGIVPQGAMAPALPGSMMPPALPPAPPKAMKQIPQSAMPALPKAAFGRDKYNYNFARDFDDYWEELE